MSDVVGAASVTIQPDWSDFASTLANALGPIVQDAIAQFQAGGQAMGAAIRDGLEPALADAATTVTSTTGEMSEAIAGGLDAGIETAAAAVIAGTEDMSAALATGLEPGLAAAQDQVSGATEGMANEIETGLDTAIAAAADDITAGTETIASSVRDSIGPAAQETAATGRDEFGRFATDATQAGADVKQNVGDSITSLGDMVKAVALGDLIADGIKAGVDTAITAIQSIVTLLPDIGEQFHRAFQQIRVGTGATGAALDDMKQSFNDVFAKTPASSEEVAGALTLVRQRLDETGNQAETTALSMIRLARVTGSDVNTTVDKATAIFNNFGVAADQQTNQLDKFLRVSQVTGVSVDDLLGSVQSSGLAFKAAGFNIDETAALIGNLSKVGLDAGAIQMGLSRAVASSAKEGIPARQALDHLFTTIAQSGDPVKATALAVENFGTRAGPRLAELIRSGRLSYADLVKTIESGGDTIDAATKDTATWRGALAILSHQLQEVLEPAALFVFGTINTAVRAVTPVISQLASYLGSVLTPVFFGLAAAAAPVWAALDKVRVAFANAILALQVGANVFEAVRVFITFLTGNPEAGFAFAGALVRIAVALIQVWNSLEPVRDAISRLFSSIGSAIATFADQNPAVILGALGAAVASIVIPAMSVLIGLLGTAAAAMWGLLAPVLAVVGPVLATAAAYAALAAALIYAYQHFQPFHDVVDQIAAIVGGVLLDALGAVSDTVTGTVIPWVNNLVTQLGNLWGVFQSGGDIAQGVGEILDNIFGNTGQWVGPFRDAATAVMTAVGGLQDQFNNFFLAVKASVLPAVQHLIDILGGGRGIVEWLVSHWYLFAAAIVAATGPVGILIAAFVFLYAKFEPVRAVVQAVIESLASLASGLAYVAGIVLGDIIGAITGLVEIFQGLFTLNWDKVSQGIYDMASGILAALTDLTSQIPDLVLGAITNITDTLLGYLARIPIIGNLFDGIKTIIDGVATTLSGLFEIITGILTLNWDTIKDGLGGALGGLRDMLAGFFGGLGGFLRDLIVQGLPVLWDGIKAAGPPLLQALGTLLSNIPGWLLTAIEGLGWAVVQGFGLLWDGIQAAWPYVVTALGAFFSNLPGWLLTAIEGLGEVIVKGFGLAWDWVVTNGPGILAAVSAWLSELPGKILGWLGDLGSTLVGWFETAISTFLVNSATALGTLAGWAARIPWMLIQNLWTSLNFLYDFIVGAVEWLIANAPGALAALWDFIRSLPSTALTILTAAVSFVADFLKSAFSWVVDHGVDLLAELLAWFASLPGTIWAAIGNLAGFLKDRLTDTFAWVTGELPGILASVFDWFTGLPGRIWDQFWTIGLFIGIKLHETFDSLRDALPGIIDGFLNWFKELPGRIVDKIGDLTTTLAGAGGQLITGLWEGFKSALGRILDGLGAIAKPFVDAFKSAFGIASPSKLMMPVGESIGQGVIVGMQGALGGLGPALGATANAALGHVRLPSVGTAAGIPGPPGSFPTASGPAGQLINLQVVVQATPGTTTDHARSMGEAAADAAAERLMAMRSRILAS